MSTESLFPSQRVYLIDVMGFIFRAYHAIPHLSTSRGLPTNAAFGIANMLTKLLREEEVKYGAIVYDAGKPQERMAIYEAYKANRPSMPEDLALQLPYIQEIIDNMGLPIISVEGHEADDVIATLALKFAAKGWQVIIVSGDKDLMCLVSDRIYMLDTMKERLYTPEEVQKRFGVTPDKLPDLLALTGDKIDNIPGVPGIGEKTASRLLNEWGSIDKVLENLDSLPSKIAEKIKAHREKLEISRRLIRLRTDLDVDLRLEDLRVKEPNRERLLNIFRELEFQKLLHELTSASLVDYNAYKIVLSWEEFESLVQTLQQTPVFAIDLETTSLDPHAAEIVGIALSTGKGTGWYVPLGHISGNAAFALRDALNRLKGILESEVHFKCGQNLKYDHCVLLNYGIDMKGIRSDSMIAAWMLNPLRKRNDLDNLAAEYLGHQMISYKELTGGKGKAAPSIASVEPQRAGKYACEDAEVAFMLCQKLEDVLSRERLDYVYRHIEMPLVRILSLMEKTGVKVDKEKLERLGDFLEARIRQLRRHIQAEAGEEFNPDSPKQLAHVLFEKLGLKKGKRTKTGYSTDVEVLKRLEGEHPIIPLILEYRTSTKLFSTYVEGLRKSIHPHTGRVHTSFNQTGTATGRLSSSNPNLQNIPARDEGRRVRELFVAEEGWKLISADYSQVELRILAHLSQDEALIDAFERELDIHTATAVRIFGVSPDAVTPDMRRKAKVINFGIIYGMGVHGLAQQLGISHGDAKFYIDSYFKTFPGVRRFIDATIEEARKTLLVRTMFGRLRPVPELRSSRKDIQSQGERIAINTPVQGTAADIIKIAMIRIHEQFEKQCLQARLILQVHDELVVEAPEDEVDAASRILKEQMESAVELRVPLKVDVNVGDNWAQVHG